MNRRRLTRRVLVAGLVGLLLSPPASAQSADFSVEVLAIRATRADDTVSPELRDIAAQLRRQFKYTGFKLEKRERKSIAAGQTHEFALVDGYLARVSPQGRSEGRPTLKFEAARRVDKKERRLIGATFTLDADRFQLVGGGGWELPGAEGDVLILAVSAR